METKEKVEFHNLPLAIYREIAAHLSQLEGVIVELIPQSSPEFDYNQSQIAGLWVNYTQDVAQQVETILAFYRTRYEV
ncbi:hypothetical protein RINTHH_8080 [Richelia intracellularis HH01]|uniref:Uncharacterized protein n=1 Tax=Richelia intracellularis HH01 TaxID=1165094 RepID=M1WZN2_9NOST|nr:hypothetical protein [Richelia intracellularis]CCH66963.1 hypothetical protein RINTHH_8080 [Richelia intracellularis HH01]